MKKIKAFWKKGKLHKVIVIFVCFIVLAVIAQSLPSDEKTSTKKETETTETTESKETTENQETTEAQEPAESEMTLGQKNALKKALSYLDYSSFSKQGLYEQLQYEGFEDADCQFAVDNCGADWMKQAEKKAESYMKYSSFSRDGLIDQLLYEGFSQEEAEHGAAFVGY